MEPINVVEPAVPRLRNNRQAPPVAGRIRCAVFNSPGNYSVARDSDAMRIRNNDWPFQKPTFFHPRCPRHLAVAIQAEISSVSRVVERIVPARNDCGNAGSHGTFADLKLSLAAN